MAGRIRLWSSYVLFFYVVTHLLNHALGLISLGLAPTNGINGNALSVRWPAAMFRSSGALFRPAPTPL